MTIPNSVALRTASLPKRAMTKYVVEYSYSELGPVQVIAIIDAQDADDAIRAAERLLYASWPNTSKVRKLWIGKVQPNSPPTTATKRTKGKA